MGVTIDRDEIRSAAEELLAAAGVSQPPVDLVDVAKLQGIERVRMRKMRRTLGTLREGANGLTVTLNKREPFRSRFTLAHEIAHTIVDPPDRKAATVVLARRKPSSDGELERLCDEIAVELLLPQEMFIDALDDEPVSMGAIFRLAKLFDSSLQATALRAGELSREPVQVICWERSGRRGIRVKAARGRDFLTGPGADEDTSLADETPIARAFRSKRTERGRQVAAPQAPDIYDCEARGFLRGDQRFVISVVRSAAEASLAAAGASLRRMRQQGAQAT